MKAAAIEEAKYKLARASEAAAALRKIKTADEFRRNWEDYLNATDGIYVKLRKGARDCQKSREWFDGVDAAREQDELLNYLHHARNADQHGLSLSFERIGPKLQRAEPDTEVPPDRVGKDLIIRLPQGPGREPLVFRFTPADGAKLVAVTDDRNGKTTQVPKYHFGKKLKSCTIPELAALPLPYLEGLVARAEKFVAQ